MPETPEQIWARQAREEEARRLRKLQEIEAREKRKIPEQSAKARKERADAYIRFRDAEARKERSP